MKPDDTLGCNILTTVEPDGDGLFVIYTHLQCDMTTGLHVKTKTWWKPDSVVSHHACFIKKAWPSKTK